MDFNVVLFLIIAFTLVLVLVRFMIAIAIPLAIFFIFAAVVYKVFFRGIRIRVKSYGTEGSLQPDRREEGLSLKYSQKITAVRDNIDSIKNSFVDDRAIKPIIDELARQMSSLLSEALDLCKKATQSEQYLESIDIAKIKDQMADYQKRFDQENDHRLKEECYKNLCMLKEAFAAYQETEKCIKLIDMEISRADNYLDIVKLKIANLALSKNISAKGEIEQITAEVKRLYDDIGRLKNNISL